VLLNQYQINYPPLPHRLRCNGHIINRAAQAFLFATEDEALADYNNSNTLIPPTEREMADWRQKGPLGKLHNIVVYIQRSPQRIASFRQLSSGLNLARDNSTRWNSWYKMLSVATKLQPAIDVFCATYKENEADWLTDIDWQNLRKIEGFLLFFHDAILSTESRDSSIEKVLPTMDFLLDQFEQGKIEYINDAFMSPCCNSGWAKLEKYYCLTERSPVYIAALVLCPQNKWNYIEDNWPEEWIPEAKAKMQEFWQTEYKSAAVEVDIPVLESQALPYNTFQAHLQKKKRPRTEIDEYKKYLQAAELPEVKDARAWWLEPAQRTSYPALSIMALDILSIPAMSAEPERLFSGAKITITDRRNKLGIESIQAIECLKCWLGSSDITWTEDN
jgi:hypothetical protein